MPTPSPRAELPGPLLPVERVLATDPDAAVLDRRLGASREGRPVVGCRRGSGPLGVSLIGGCHADEPVGPEMLRRLATYLSSLPAEAPELQAATWSLVPHVNPDGEARNRGWSEAFLAVRDSQGADDRAYDLTAYLDGVVREGPEDDLEWGFPLDPEDRDARPENLAVADFLRPQAPFALHASYHSMGFAEGPWFLLEGDWEDRTEAMRRRLGKAVAAMGYELHDVDREGEKGFHRIAPGFCTRPDSRAMAAYFIGKGDAETAAIFQPSSMEFVRSLGGDPLTLVSEMPLFLMAESSPEDPQAPPYPTGTGGRLAFLAWAQRRRRKLSDEAFLDEALELGIAPMPLRDQMRLQLAFLNEGLAAVSTIP